MRSWLTDRQRIVVFGGLAVVLTVALGVIWGIADAGRIEASEASSTTHLAEVTTTTEQLVPASPQVPESTTTTEPGRSTTTPQRAPESGGGPGPTEPLPPNQPPIIEDLGISSEGMKLTISPVVSDPENDPVELFFELDGNRMIVPDGADSVTSTVDRGSDYVVVVSVTVGAADSAGNEVVASFDHEMKAITTVSVRDIRFEVGAGGCFDEKPAQRILASIQLDGVVQHLSDESEELRADRNEVTFIDEITGELVGEPPLQSVAFNALLAGQNDSYRSTDTGSDQVLHSLFSNTPCRGSLTYTVEMETR